jgi:hypothetical protein
VLLNPRAVVDEARKEEPRTAVSDGESKKKFGNSAVKSEAVSAKSGAAGSEKTEKKPGDATGDNPPTAGGPGAGGPPRPAGGLKPPTVADIMKQDADKDGKISKEEATDRLKEQWGQNDTNGDDFLDRTEVKAMVDRIAERFKQRQQQGGGGPPGGQ